MTNENFVTKVKIKVEFSELSQKAFTKMKQFWKFLSMGTQFYWKALKGLILRAGVSRMFFLHNLHGQQAWNFNVWTDVQASGRWVDWAEWVRLQIWAVFLSLKM